MKHNRIISALLALSMVLSAFVMTACDSKDSGNSETENSGTADTEAVKTEISLDGYKVVRNDNTKSNDLIQACVRLRRELNEIYGNVDIATDYEKDKSKIPANAKEVLVGDTNRAPSVAALEELGVYDYIIRFEGDFLVICGGSDAATSKAVDAFIEKYAADGQITVPEDINIMYKLEKIDNSSLMPKYVSDEFVTLEPAEENGEAMTPDWAKSLIMMEVHLETATPEGTFASAVKVLDHCAEMGVNGIWLTPVYEKGPGGNGYGNVGPHSVEPALTGTKDYDEGWQVVKNFVDEAHSRNIRIFLDVITWGTITAAPLFKEHPDWYKGEAWGNQAFNWRNSEFVDWFVDTCANNIIVTGADGFRCDCEPNYTHYSVFNRIRQKCLDAGRKILVIAEDGCERRDCFDFEQDGVLWYSKLDRGGQYAHPLAWYINSHLDIVESIKKGRGIGSADLQSKNKSGNYRFYTFCVSNHDYQRSITNGNRLVIGYQAILAPFIPLWYFGAEWNQQAADQVIYFVNVDWSCLDNYENTLFYEDLKKYIQIRRTYPEIFEYCPENHKDSNICKVEATGTNLTAYARYTDDKAILIIPNNSGAELTTTVTLPSSEISLPANPVVTDLLTGETVTLSGDKFEATIQDQYIGIYLVK